MDDAGIPALTDAIRHLHGCEARHIETVPIREMHPDGRVVWEGDVEVFELIGHPTAKRCYAWSHVTTGTRRQRHRVHGERLGKPRKRRHRDVHAGRFRWAGRSGRSFRNALLRHAESTRAREGAFAARGSRKRNV